MTPAIASIIQPNILGNNPLVSPSRYQVNPFSRWLTNALVEFPLVLEVTSIEVNPFTRRLVRFLSYVSSLLVAAVVVQLISSGNPCSRREDSFVPVDLYPLGYPRFPADRSPWSSFEVAHCRDRRSSGQGTLETPEGSPHEGNPAYR